MSRKPEPALRILAVGAHPDDLEFACGGILLSEAARGGEIYLLVCSRGESGSNGTAEEREAEARAAAGILGAQIEFIDLGGDSHFEVSNENALALARQVRKTKPHILFSSVTSPDQHPDHAVIGSLCRDAARLARYGGIPEMRDLAPHAIEHHFQYAVTPAAEPPGLSVRVDISAHFDAWVRVMECHRTQLRTRSYIELQTARARLLGAEAGVASAQALFPRDHLLIDSLGEWPPSIRLF
ncbi:MAG: PIG-L family deacetylase [Chthoniobacterales bacterium]|nr:PIG-L family deacetylase [Chthoniobacterales bacterium]MDQ3120690.1 PIG-L family deacetylase [Verrucomicrobiota bacterium]